MFNQNLKCMVWEGGKSDLKAAGCRCLHQVWSFSVHFLRSNGHSLFLFFCVSYMNNQQAFSNMSRIIIMIWLKLIISDLSSHLTRTNTFVIQTTKNQFKVSFQKIMSKQNESHLFVDSFRRNLSTWTSSTDVNKNRETLYFVSTDLFSFSKRAWCEGKWEVDEEKWGKKCYVD